MREMGPEKGQGRPGRTAVQYRAAALAAWPPAGDWRRRRDWTAMGWVAPLYARRAGISADRK